MAIKKLYLAAGAAAVLLLLSTRSNKALAAITTKLAFRGNDAFGSGAFQASRDGGIRPHNGVDIVASPGEAVYSPITGTVTRIAYPYADDLNYKGLEIVNNSYKVKMFYISPIIAIGSNVKAGQKIAVSQNIAARYGTGMINHVHIEVYDNAGKLLNPTYMF